MSDHIHLDVPGGLDSQKMTVRDFFDLSDSWQGRMYDEQRDRFDRAMARRKVYTLEMIGYLDDLPNDVRVLDIGCGCGEYMEAFRKRGFDVYGMDISPRMLEACKQRLGYADADASERLRCGDIEHLPFESASFDLITCVGVFGYLLKDDVAIREIMRVLRPGGFAYVSVQNIMSFANMDFVFRSRVSEILTGRPSPWRSSDRTAWFLPRRPHDAVSYQYKLYDPRAFERALAAARFTIVDVRTFGHEFRVFRRLRLMTESFWTTLEIALDRLTARHRIPVLSYAGETYSVIVRKPSQAR